MNALYDIHFVYLFVILLSCFGRKTTFSLILFYEYAIFHNAFLSHLLDVWKIRFWSAFNVASYGPTQNCTGKVNTFIKQCSTGTKVAKEKPYKICIYHLFTNKLTYINCQHLFDWNNVITITIIAIMPL